MKRIITIIRSGGQSGVDRAALDFARKHNLEICGWCPKGGWAEDCPEAVAADTVEYAGCAGDFDDHADGICGVQGD